MKIPRLRAIKRQSLFFLFIIPLPFTMKLQTLFLLLSLIAMLKSLKQVEGVFVDDEAIQSNDNIGFTCQWYLIYFPNLTEVIEAAF